MTMVRCPHCGVSPMKPCVAVGTDKPLRYSSMHPARLAALGEEPDYGAVDRYRKVIEDEELEKAE